MGILDFFRKKRKKEKTQETEIKPEEISFNEIGSWLDGKINGISESEEKIFELAKIRIDLFIKEINEKTRVLEEIDIESKKENERAKIIVRQSLDNYLSFVYVFIRELSEIEKQNLSKFIGVVGKIFSDFEKPSYIFYERASFLIGNELAAVKQEINQLSEYFNELFNESKNKKIIETFDVISSVKLKLKQLNEIDIVLNGINIEIKSLDKKIMMGEENEERVLDEIEKIKASKDYIENLKKQGEINKIEKELIGIISELKILINFKALSNAFHSDENKMKIIKNYKGDFKESMAKDDGDDILELISEAKLNNDVIADEIKQIKEIKQKISEDKKLIKKDETKILLEEIQKIKSEIEDMRIKKFKHEKRSEGIKDNRDEVRELIKQEILKLGGEVV